MNAAEPIDGEIKAIGSAYRLLGRLWQQELTATLLDELCSGSLSQPFQQLGGQRPKESLEDLAIEYCRLLIGPKGHYPPVESVWRTSELESSSANSVKRFAELVHYEAPPLEMRVPWDHLGSQLDLAGWMLWRVASSRDDQEREIYWAFHSRHLSWCGKFLDGVQRDASIDFYRTLAQVTREVCEIPIEI